jgi:hypothetical protein
MREQMSHFLEKLMLITNKVTSSADNTSFKTTLDQFQKEIFHHFDNAVHCRTACGVSSSSPLRYHHHRRDKRNFVVRSSTSPSTECDHKSKCRKRAYVSSSSSTTTCKHFSQHCRARSLHREKMTHACQKTSLLSTPPPQSSRPNALPQMETPHSPDSLSLTSNYEVTFWFKL